MKSYLGSAIDDKAGVLSMLTPRGWTYNSSILFDNLDRAQKQLGEMMVDIIQNNFTPGKIKKF